MSTAPTSQKRALEVLEIATHKLVHSINVTGQPDRIVEKAMRGMQINLSEEFFIRDTADEPEVIA